jgi:hypothetical protein
LIDVLELPTMTQDLEVFAPALVGPLLRDAVLRQHGVMHVLFHPGHLDKQPVVDALMSTAAQVKVSGMEWWTARQLNDWERARRRVLWNHFEQTENSFRVRLRSEESLQDATLLFLSSTPAKPLVNGQEYSSAMVMRWGFEFQAITLDLEKDAECVLQLEH